MNHKIAIISVLLLVSLMSATSEEFSVPAAGYSLDLPEQWQPLDISDLARISYTDATQTAVLQVLVYAADTFARASDMFTQIKTGLKADGEGAPFMFSGDDAVLSDLQFDTARFRARGYFIFVNGKQFDYALLSFTPASEYAAQHDFLLSALDSFAIGEDGKLQPGPISQFYYPFPGQNKESYLLTLAEKTYTAQLDHKEAEATQVLVEREARVLNNSKGDFIEAWRRYYKLIYRDNYRRLGDLSKLLRQAFLFDGEGRREKIGRLLSWIQKFEYYRTGTISDLTSPTASAFSRAGDCDSRALLLVIFLHQLGIDAILLVSTEYSHSAVGVDADGPGARVDYKGKSYLFAEVTEEVDLGLVDRNMADPAAWIAVPLGAAASEVSEPVPALN